MLREVVSSLFAALLCLSHWAASRKGSPLACWPSQEFSRKRGIGECRTSFRGGQAWGKGNNKAPDPSCARTPLWVPPDPWTVSVLNRANYFPSSEQWGQRTVTPCGRILSPIVCLLTKSHCNCQQQWRWCSQSVAMAGKAFRCSVCVECEQYLTKFYLIFRDIRNNEISWAIEDSICVFDGMKKLNTLWGHLLLYKYER